MPNFRSIISERPEELTIPYSGHQMLAHGNIIPGSLKLSLELVDDSAGNLRTLDGKVVGSINYSKGEFGIDKTPYIANYDFYHIAKG